MSVLDLIASPLRSTLGAILFIFCAPHRAGSAFRHVHYEAAIEGERETETASLLRSRLSFFGGSLVCFLSVLKFAPSPARPRSSTLVIALVSELVMCRDFISSPVYFVSALRRFLWSLPSLADL